MKQVSYKDFLINFNNFQKRKRMPFVGQLELTYRCNYDCVHCYCKGILNEKDELTTKQWKKIINEIHKQGCIFLCITGGEPLLREDLFEIYSYAKEKGFLISLFTNGSLFTKKIISFFKKKPPLSIEVTLNGIKSSTYEKITQSEGSFTRIMLNLKDMAKSNLPLIVKSNCLKINKDEIREIKYFSDKLLGKGRFQYDDFIFPKLNGDIFPLNYRLKPEELINLKKTDRDIWKEYRASICSQKKDFNKYNEYKYLCTSWTTEFFINPSGILKFCLISNKYTTDLKKESFKKGFYCNFLQILKEKFNTSSKCKNCKLRNICYYCPERAYLETGNDETAIPYFCKRAESDENKYMQ